jgi:hypothetical protein
MTPAQIALVMELSAAVTAEARPVSDDAALRRRERDRDYQAQKRASRRQTSADSDDIADAPFPAPPNENNLTPPTHTPVNKTTRARRLPDDWQPSPLPSELGAKISTWSQDDLDEEMAKFRDWAKSAPDKSGLKSDWDAAWRNWLRRKIGDRKNATNCRMPAKPDRRDGFAKALDEIIDAGRATGNAQPPDRYPTGDGQGHSCRAVAAPSGM